MFSARYNGRVQQAADGERKEAMTDHVGPERPAPIPWWPEPRDRGSDREPLSRSQIIDAAIRLIDADGIEAFSMRRLAQELGAGATSLYWHVRDKDQLIDLVLDEITGEVRLDDDPGLPWTERAAYLAREFRAAVRRHRNLASVYGTRLALGPNMLRGIEHLLAILREAGFGSTQLTLAFSAILNFALGTAIMECRALSGPEATGKSPEEVQVLFVQMLMSLPSDQYPNLKRFIPDSDDEGISEDAQFEYGLQRLLDGLSADLSAGLSAAESRPGGTEDL
jgi:AcrR family transcriptional regulator